MVPESEHCANDKPNQSQCAQSPGFANEKTHWGLLGKTHQNQLYRAGT